VVVSEAIDCMVDPGFLVAFLKAFTNASSSVRGWDSSITRVSPSENLRLQTKIALLGSDLSEKRLAGFRGDLLQFTIPSIDHPGEEIVCYGGYFPDFRSNELFSRGTHCWVVFIEEGAGGKFAYYKRSWRYDARGMEQEGVILQKLSIAQVPYVPTLLGHGDLAGKWTKTILGAMREWTSEDDRPVWANEDLTKNVRTHRQYHILVAEVGTKLQGYRSSKELARTVYDAIFGSLYCVRVAAVVCLPLSPAAHVAFKKAHYMHRDISAGNILIFNDHGLLTDWEFAKPVDNNGRLLDPPRVSFRTGAFLSLVKCVLLTCYLCSRYMAICESFSRFLRVRSSCRRAQMSANL
jgi:hypothetical protein